MTGIRLARGFRSVNSVTAVLTTTMPDTNPSGASDKRSVNEVIAELLYVEGTDRVFTYLSEDMMNLVAAFDKYDESSVIHSRHEQDAVAMADGFSRHTKEIGVCTVGQGGAIGQTGSALVTARKRGSNVLVIVPESSRALSVDNPTPYSAPSPGIEAKNFNQEDFLRNTIEKVHPIRSSEAVIPVFKKVFRELKLDNGPIAVQIPQDVLNGSVTVPDSLVESLETPVEIHTDAETTVRPSEETIQQTVEYYLDSDATKHPLIVVGNGAAREEYRSEIESLAERMGGVLATTFRGKGFFPEHPYYVGTIGETGNYLAVEYATEADFVLALGCGLNGRTQDAGRLFPDEATVIQVDINPHSLGRYGEITQGIHADAGTATRLLNDALADHDIHRADELWTDDLQTEISEYDPFADATLSDKPDRIDPRVLVQRLHDILPYNRVVVCDGGHQARWVYRAIDVHSPDHLICRGDFSTIGLGLPMGMGAAVGADDDTTSVVFCGDGAFLMHLPEVSTAARYDMPLIVVVMNDDVLGAEYHRLADDSKPLGKTESPDLAAVAEALGADAYQVTGEDDIDAVASSISERPAGPVVVECLLDRDVQTSL